MKFPWVNAFLEECSIIDVAAALLMVRWIRRRGELQSLNIWTPYGQAPLVNDVHINFRVSHPEVCRNERWDVSTCSGIHSSAAQGTRGHWARDVSRGRCLGSWRAGLGCGPSAEK